MLGDFSHWSAGLAIFIHFQQQWCLRTQVSKIYLVCGFRVSSRALCDALALVDKKQKFLEETEETDENEVS